MDFVWFWWRGAAAQNTDVNADVETKSPGVCINLPADMAMHSAFLPPSFISSYLRASPLIPSLTTFPSYLWDISLPAWMIHFLLLSLSLALPSSCRSCDMWRLCCIIIHVCCFPANKYVPRIEKSERRISSSLILSSVFFLSCFMLVISLSSILTLGPVLACFGH